MVSSREKPRLPATVCWHADWSKVVIDWAPALCNVTVKIPMPLASAALLASYAVVMTGTHPEYWTERMLDAITSYVDGGGHLMYLGGNGIN